MKLATTITNTNINDARFKLDLTKVSEEYPDLTLSGAEFELINNKDQKLSFVGENGVYTVSYADRNADTNKIYV